MFFLFGIFVNFHIPANIINKYILHLMLSLNSKFWGLILPFLGKQGISAFPVFAFYVAKLKEFKIVWTFDLCSLLCSTLSFTVTQLLYLCYSSFSMVIACIIGKVMVLLGTPSLCIDLFPFLL